MYVCMYVCVYIYIYIYIYVYIWGFPELDPSGGAGRASPEEGAVGMQPGIHHISLCLSLSPLSLYICIYVYIYIYIYIYVYVHVYIYIYRERETYYVCVYIYIYIYICICVYTYIYIYICIYIYRERERGVINVIIINGSTQKVPPSNSMQLAVTPLVLTPFVPFRWLLHTCHILPPSEIDLSCVWLLLQAQKGDIYFTESAERVEYGNYVLSPRVLRLEAARPHPQ